MYMALSAFKVLTLTSGTYSFHHWEQVYLLIFEIGLHRSDKSYGKDTHTHQLHVLEIELHLNLSNNNDDN